MAFETVAPMNEELERTEFDRAFCKTSNFYSIDFLHFFAKGRKLVEKMIHQKKNRGHRTSKIVKVIPQKLNLPMNFFETFPESSLLSTVSKNRIKMICHYSRLRDTMGQSYPIYACTSAYHAHYLSVHVALCGSSKHTLLK